MSNDRKISVVIPVYNSAGSLRMLLDRLTTTLEAMQRDYEIICIDDCSRDESWQVLSELKPVYPSRLRLAQLLVNSGQHNAILCGFSLVSGQVIVTMDDDLQNPPEEIPKLVTAVDAGYDLAIGSYAQKQHARVRNLGGGLIDWLLRRIFSLPAATQLTSFRAVQRPVVEQVNAMTGSFPYITAMLLTSASRYTNVPVEHHPRLVGRSNYTLSRMVYLASNLVFHYSLYPVLLVVAASLLSVIVSAASGLIIVYLYITSQASVPGWTSIMLVTSSFSSLILVCLSIVAMYLARLHQQVSHTRAGYRIGRLL